MMTMRATMVQLTAVAMVLAGCGGGGNDGKAAPPADSAVTVTQTSAALPACTPDNGGITLPAGFCALVVADSVGQARHVAVTPSGDLYVAVQTKQGSETPSDKGGVLGLRDTNGDGKFDQRVTFGPEGGTGMAIQGQYLYFATNTAVLRYTLGSELQPAGKPDTLVEGLPAGTGHTAKSIALGPDGKLFVNIGSGTNICQAKDRQPGAKGQDPCPELATRAGVWRFDAARLHQTEAQGERWATGIRNAVALAWNPADNSLYAMQHGRDQLNLWPPYTEQDNAERPAEELLRLDPQGKDFGWPYCWYDNQAKKLVPSPEFGGGPEQTARCAQKENPILAFPGHWAPNGLLFYTGRQFPQKYQGGALIAFHGSWNRAPLPQAGYKVVFVPFQGSTAQPAYETFADGFGGPGQATGNALHRPVGLAQGPDGSVFITDDQGGRIWRVMYTGK
jgi:glucose/arabinose dehydrogenase